MKVIILCGGAGTRLKEETEFKPKPMVYVGNKPIIWHIMKIYAHYGFNEFVLALGYKADYIKDFFLNQKAFTTDFTLNTKTHNTVYHFESRNEIDDFTITFVDTGLETLPGERILRCKKYISPKDTDFMVTYGDGVSDVNIKSMFTLHKKKNTIGTLIGIHPKSKYGIITEQKKDKKITFNEKPDLSSWVNGGFMIFKRNFFSFLKRGETEHPALRRLAKEKQLSLYKYEGFWFCMDTYKEVEALNNMWKMNNPPWKVWK